MPASVEGRDAALDLAPGAHVHVRLGLDVVDVVIVDRYNSVLGGDILVVRAANEEFGESDPATFTVPESEVLSAEEAAAEGPPGTWVHSAKYDRGLDSALSRTFRRRGSHILKSAVVGDREYDYLVDLGDVQLVVEEKFLRHGEITEKIADRIISHLDHLPRARKIVVSNVAFAPAAAERLRARRIEPVTWRTDRDDAALARAVAAALA
jgi:hypothetical protein